MHNQWTMQSSAPHMCGGNNITFWAGYPQPSLCCFVSLPISTIWVQGKIKTGLNVCGTAFCQVGCCFHLFSDPLFVGVLPPTPHIVPPGVIICSAVSALSAGSGVW